jgi:hypothetical protein
MPLSIRSRTEKRQLVSEHCRLRRRIDVQLLVQYDGCTDAVSTAPDIRRVPEHLSPFDRKLVSV